MPNTPLAGDALIDEFLSDHEFSAAYEILIDVPPSVVYRCLLSSDFSRLPLVRSLMTLRTGKWRQRNSGSRDLRQRFQSNGFVILAEVPYEELVIGVAGRFWRPDGGRSYGSHSRRLFQVLMSRICEGGMEFQVAGGLS
jgi:hypothetical protein